jgi:hypothetical protein
LATFSRLVDAGGIGVKITASFELTVPTGPVEAGCTNEISGERLTSPGTSPTLDAALAKTVTPETFTKEQNVVSTFSAAIRAAGLSGGIALSPPQRPESVCSFGAKTVAEVIERIRAARPELSFDWNSSAINLVDSRISDLLGTRVEHLDIPHPTTDPLGSVLLVLSTPELKAHAAALGLVDRTQYPNPAQALAAPLDELPLNIADRSARDILNLIIKAHHAPGIWIYQEWRRSNAQRSFHMEFILSPIKSVQRPFDD